MAKFDRKITVVVGCATGIGNVLAKRFAYEGATVILCDIQEEKGKAATEEIRAAGGNAVFFHADATKENEIVALFEMIKQQFGRLDFALNVVGTSRQHLIENMNMQDFDLVMKTCLYSIFYCMKQEIRMMEENGGGVILSIASVNSSTASDYQSPYCVAKAALEKLSKTAAIEEGPNNIRICTIHPGQIITAMSTKFTSRPAAMEEIIYKTPLRKTGTPEDVANMAVYLCSDEASYISGASFYVDGGMSLEGFPDSFRIIHGAPVPRGEKLQNTL